MINRKFLNYKYYSSFIRDLNSNQISKDAIVFIQDESHPCIWTHGKEYMSGSGPFVIIPESDFPPANPISDKIYIVVKSGENDTCRYMQYIYKDGEWAYIGDFALDINLSFYLTRTEASNIYQVKGDYATQEDLTSSINTAIEYVTGVVRDNYVQKKQVYTPNEEIPSDAGDPIDPNQHGGESGGNGEGSGEQPGGETGGESGGQTGGETGGQTGGDDPGNNNNNTGDGYTHCFLSQEEYDGLESYDNHTIYFIYEESETWAFGDEFPVILS